MQTAGVAENETGRLKTQVRKTQVRICNGGKRKYSNLKSILKSLRYSTLAFSVDPLSVGLDQFTCTVPDRCYTQEIGLRHRRAWVQIIVAKLSGNSLKQTVHTHRASIHQAAKLVAVLLRAAMVTARLAESNGSLPPGL